MGIKKSPLNSNEHYPLLATSTNDDVTFSSANMRIIFGMAKRKARLFANYLLSLTAFTHL